MHFFSSPRWISSLFFRIQIASSSSSLDLSPPPAALASASAATSAAPPFCALQAAQAALDAEKQKREAQQAAAKASSKPSGKVPPADAKPAKAAKKGRFGFGKKKK